MLFQSVDEKKKKKKKPLPTSVTSGFFVQFCSWLESRALSVSVWICVFRAESVTFMIQTQTLSPRRAQNSFTVSSSITSISIIVVINWLVN